MSDPIDHSPKKIPFQWERKPGVCRVKDGEGLGLVPKKLPPPPCTAQATARNSIVADLQIPLPPCPFLPPYHRTSSKKRLIWVQDDDPFFTAYKECTKTGGFQSTLRKGLLIFSCKRCCPVRDNNVVRISHLP